MNTNRQTKVIQGNNKERTMQVTAANIIRWSGLAALGAGSLFIAVQAIHPLDVLSSVTTTRWAMVHYLSIVMDFLGLLGVAGLYARQVEKAGWLGLAGYLLFSIFWAVTLAFHFAEAFFSPVLATAAPAFVESFLGIVSSTPAEMNLGPLPTIYLANGLCYLLGGLLLGIATFRAGILPRWAAGLLAFGIVLPILGSSLVPHPFDRIFALPVGFALAWLGYALWAERREQGTEPVLSTPSTQLRQAGAK